MIELVCVIATVAVLSAIALPHWASAVQNQQMNLAIRRISGDIALAQSRANYGSASVTMTFNPSTNTYQIVGMPDPDRPAQTYTVNLSGDPYHVTLTSASFSTVTGGASAGTTTSASLGFDGYGTPLGGGTIVLTQGSTTRTMTIDATSGKVLY
jgi:type II secretory pathway pseudopilin PulG